MSYGTSFTAQVYINRRRYNDIGEVNNEIDEVRKELDQLWDKVLALMSTTPANSVDAEGYPVNGIDWVVQQYHNLKEEIQDKIFYLGDLFYLKENFDTRENE